MGLIPFYVEATLGTTSCCSFDNLAEIGKQGRLLPVPLCAVSTSSRAWLTGPINASFSATTFLTTAS